MKRVDIVDVKADIKDDELKVEVSKYGEILLIDMKTGESVRLGEIGVYVR